MPIQIITDSISMSELKKLAENQFGYMIKAVVDVDKEIIAVGGELHADEEAALIENGSSQNNLWGINVIFERPREEMIEYESMINIRPKDVNRSRSVKNPEVIKKINEIVYKLVKD